MATKRRPASKTPSARVGARRAVRSTRSGKVPPKTAAKRAGNAVARYPSRFDLAEIAPSIRKSPLRLRDWLELHLPWLVGPRIDALEPAGGQRGTILIVRGARFAAARSDNEVSINGTLVPVLAASASELRVLVTESVDTGAVKVKVGTRTATAASAFTVKGYPGDADDGPPVFAQGAGAGGAGDVNPIGTLRVMVVVCQVTDRVPANLATVRTGLNTAWSSVQTYYTQSSFTRTNVQFDIAAGAAQLDGTFNDFVDLSAAVQNIRSDQLGRVAAFAARQAQNEGFNLNNYQMLCAVVFTNGDFIRAWGGSDTQTFSYDNGLPTADPGRININIQLNQKINLLWINESADWGRFAHEFGHNIVSAPTNSGDGTATLGEDVYGSDLVDSSAATAQDFELMGNHDTRPLFTGFHLEKLGYYNNANIRELSWDRNPHSEEIDVVAHGLNENTTAGRVHIVKVNVSDALTYYVEVRQRPGTTTQVFDPQIPIGASANQGGVIVTRVIAGEMHNNQQTRFISLMHDDRVQLTGDFIEDPARALRITVVNDNVQARPQVCKVRVEWAQTVVNDPNGAFDLSVTPWNGNYESPDIWVDRDPTLGVFDNPTDAQGRPTGNGDKPWVNHVNQFTARINVSGAMGASNVKATFYAVSPPGVGDNGNWSPIAVKNIANIAQSSFVDVACNWVPVVGKHTCLRVFASQQFGEISGENNGAQENVSDFKAAGSSPADPLFIRTAVRNPLDERRRIHLALTGLPAGWVGQIPHSWMWLDGKAEREIDVMVWPVADINVYRFGSNKPKEGRFPGLAPVKVKGFVERSYTEEMGPLEQVVGSRFYAIGGTFYRVSVARRASIRLEVESKGERKDQIVAHAVVGPAMPGQRVLVDVELPDGKTHRSVEAQTDATGRVNAALKLLDDKKKLQGGPYRVQAFIHNALDLDDAESNVVTMVR